MPISDIVVHLDGNASWRSCAGIAFDLARRYQAHLTGLGIKQPVPWGCLPARLCDKLDECGDRELRRLAMSFKDAARAAGHAAQSSWMRSDLPLAAALASASRYSDLLIIGRGDGHGARGDQLMLPGEVAMMSGRPLLAIPRVGALPSIGRRVSLAWNGSREAARAVSDALPFLQEAEDVVVVTVEETGVDDGGESLARYLARHGVGIKVERHASSERSIAELILDTVRRCSSDLLVLGCYGHTRVREAIFGGVTRDVLRSTSTAVLLSH